MNKEMDAVLKDEAIRKRLTTMGFSNIGAGTPQSTGDYVKAQRAAWGTLVKEIGLKPE
jgi:tripartite-type tricarboxylate transporter receptor subunit TctC